MRLGLNTRVSFDSGPGGAERGLRDGTALFQAAERLGYQSGWAYQRHFDNYLSSPLPFFAAVGQHTERIMVGRLNLALSSGQAGFERVFGQLKADPGISAADELVLFLPPAFGLAENERVLADVAHYVAPALGWVVG